MTLVEVIVSVALLGLITVFLLGVLGVSLSVISRNAASRQDIRNAAAGIENTMAGETPSSDIAVVSEIQSDFSIVFGGITVSDEGKYIKSENADGGAALYYYAPDTGSH